MPHRVRDDPAAHRRARSKRRGGAGLIVAAHPELAIDIADDAEPIRTASLPIPPTALLGRESEVVDACDLLRRPDHPSGTRLLTLSGPGGVGNTRFAIAVAAAIDGDFADGVAWVELASLAIRD